MKPAQWDRMHDRFDEAVFDPVASDLHGAFRHALERYGRGARLVADFGCGTGRNLPLLAARFERVVGLDFAPKLLRLAEQRAGHLANVEIARADLRRSAAPARHVELGVCVNAWIMPRFDDRRRMLATMRRSLARHAPLLLVVPSLEAALYANDRLVEWNRRSGLRGAALLREGIRPSAAAARDLLGGVIDLDGSRTKHFLREEAHAVLRDARLELVHEARVEYPWDAYFDRPPRWLREPRPWDWLFVARRV